MWRVLNRAFFRLCLTALMLGNAYVLFDFYRNPWLSGFATFVAAYYGFASIVETCRDMRIYRKRRALKVTSDVSSEASED